MKYIVDVNGARIEVEVEADGVRVDGRLIDARLTDVAGTPIHLVTRGSEVHRVASRRGDSRGRYVLWMDGYRYEVEALDERMRAIRDLTAAHAAATGPRPLVAPMPGLIVHVHATAGDRVDAGQGVVVMEAMKMENELRTTTAGIVQTVHVSPGMIVEKGAVLMEFSEA